MCVTAEDHVDAGDDGCHLEIHVHAVVGQHHHHIRLLVFPCLVDDLLHVVVADTEGPFGDEARGIGDRCVGKGLTDHRHPGTTDGLDHVGLEGGAFVRVETAEILELVVEQGVLLDLDVLGHEVTLELPDVGDHLRIQIGELPVTGHHVHAQQIAGADHVLAAGPVGGAGSLPGVAAVQQQAVAGAAIVTQPLDQGLQMGKTADLTELMGRLVEIQIGEGMGLDSARLDPEVLEQFGTDQMGWLVVGGTHPQVDVGLAEIDRIELGMAVGDVQ